MLAGNSIEDAPGVVVGHHTWWYMGPGCRVSQSV